MIFNELGTKIVAEFCAREAQENCFVNLGLKSPTLPETVTIFNQKEYMQKHELVQVFRRSSIK